MELPSLITSLDAALQLPLPGREMQYQMAHLSRRTVDEIPIRADVRPAAVLILLYEVASEWTTVLIGRKSIQGDVHAGQMSFPGGRMQSGESAEQAALRETHEEIGLSPARIQPLGRLTELHIPVSNHLVFPVVGFYPGSPAPWSLQENEVEFVLETPLRTFLDPENRTVATIRTAHGLTLQNVPAFTAQGHLVWGATAMILSEFCSILRSTGLDMDL